MPDETKAIEAEQPSFLAVLKSLEDGSLESDLTEDLVQLVHDMRAQGLATGGKQKGKITVTLEVRLDGGIFEIVPGYKITPPKKPRSRSIYYPTKDNGLSTQNAAQMSLGLPRQGKDVTGARPLAIA